MPWREQAFLAWAGLRGGVPIVFATIPIAAGLAGGVAVRRRVLRRDRLGGRAGADAAHGGAPARRHRAATAATARPSLTPTRCAPPAPSWSRSTPPRSASTGRRCVRDLALPSGAVIAAIRRDGQVVLPRGTTPVEPATCSTCCASATRAGRPRADRRPPRGGPRRVDGLHAAPLRPRPRRRHPRAGRIPRVLVQDYRSWCTSRAPTRSPC